MSFIRTAGTTGHVTSSKGIESELMGLYYDLFDVCIAKSPEDIRECHAIRYQVYCLETGFLPKDENPGGLETDIHDIHSEQALLIHKPTGASAGTVRIVMPDPEQPFGGSPARMASKALQELGDELPLATTGEISRMSISKLFRQRVGDNLFPPVQTAPEINQIKQFKRIIPHITLGLMQAVFVMTMKHRLTHLCAVADPALLRAMRRLGLHFHPVGDVIEFHGKRQPVYCSLDELSARVRDEKPDVWEIITDYCHVTN